MSSRYSILWLLLLLLSCNSYRRAQVHFNKSLVHPEIVERYCHSQFVKETGRDSVVHYIAGDSIVLLDTVYTPVDCDSIEYVVQVPCVSKRVRVVDTIRERVEVRVADVAGMQLLERAYDSVRVDAKRSADKVLEQRALINRYHHFFVFMGIALIGGVLFLYHKR